MTIRRSDGRISNNFFRTVGCSFRTVFLRTKQNNIKLVFDNMKLILIVKHEMVYYIILTAYNTIIF